MVSVQTKTIKSHKYLYAEHSFRLPNQKIKKVSKMIKNKSDVNKKEVKEYLLNKEIEENIKFIEKTKEKNSLINIKKIETIKVKYKHLMNKLTKNQKKDILDRFTANFTYETNAIEGNSLTLKDVTMFMTDNLIPKDKDLREVYETRNMRNVIELLFNKKIKINKKSIIKLHSEIVKDTGVSTGFKKFPNFIVMTNLRTTPPEKVEQEIDKLIRWYEKNKDKKHILELCSIFHGKFENIHPFEDGNGRIGRILLNAMLMEKGYPPLIIRKTMRKAYFDCLSAFDNKHNNKLIRFILNKFENTFKKFFEVYFGYL